MLSVHPSAAIAVSWDRHPLPQFGSPPTLWKEEVSRKDAKTQRKPKIGLDEYPASIYLSPLRLCVSFFHRVGGGCPFRFWRETQFQFPYPPRELAKGRNRSCNRLSINTLQRRNLLPICASGDGDSSLAKIERHTPCLDTLQYERYCPLPRDNLHGRSRDSHECPHPTYPSLPSPSSR